MERRKCQLSAVRASNTDITKASDIGIAVFRDRRRFAIVAQRRLCRTSCTAITILQQKPK